jgi:hypothetical protein
MIMYAYRNAGGDIVGLSTVERTLTEAQAVNPEIASVDPDPSQEDIDVFNASQSLHRLKHAKMKAIDARTDELIAAGFTYADKSFSLSLAAQAKMMGTHQVKDDPALTYPINWNTINDDDVYAIANATDLNGFYLTGLGTYRTHVDGGTSLKDQVRAATTEAEVNAIVDNR